jgi:hypothetical protein
MGLEMLFEKEKVTCLRTALMEIRKIRRNKLIPEHEKDEVYNIATEALNKVGY